MSYHLNQELYEYKIIVPKDRSSFLYFILESNENISFYSTQPFEKGSLTREIVVRCTPELNQALTNILEHCKSRFDLNIISVNKIADQL